MYLDLDRFKRENFKYKAFSMILLVILGIVFAPNISISQKDNSNKFVKQLAPEDIQSFEVLYAAETLMNEYDLVNVQSASHTNNRFAYVSSIYKNDDGKEITFIQSKDIYFDARILQQTNLANIPYDSNIYYFTQKDQSNLLFWCNDNTAYFLFSDLDYEISKEISKEIIANKIKLD